MLGFNDGKIVQLSEGMPNFRMRGGIAREARRTPLPIQKLLHIVIQKLSH